VDVEGEDPSGNHQLAHNVLKLEMALANITMDRTKLRDPIKNYHKYTEEELYKLSPPLKHYFANRPENKEFWEKSPELFTSTPSFFEGLQGVLDKHPIKTIKGYLKWHLTKSLVSVLSDKLSEPYFQFYAKDLSGVKARTARWERCYYSAGSHLPHILGRAFVAHSFKGKSKDTAQKMIGMIEDSFGEELSKLSWLDAKTKQKGQVKLAAMVDMIGYPDKWHTYSKAILGDDHLQNMLALDRLSNDRNLNKLGKPADKTEWGMSPAEVNAYNSLQTNTIVFPAAILQPPFFNSDFPMALNFGAIGSVMGHELSHGFDDAGHLYDKDGKLNSWWSPDIAKKFKAKVDCVSAQYSNFLLPGKPDLHVNGKLTLGEDLADNGGLQASFLAYQKWAAQQPEGMEGQTFGEGKGITGKDGKLTGDQVFFYGFAQSWCTKQAVKAERQQVVTDPHAPSEFRVAGAVANSPAFAQAFGCSAGTKMNPDPKKRCLVWTEHEKQTEK